MIVLDLCGGTGAWSEPYREANYEVRLITLPVDVRLLPFPGHVQGILAAPPCTVFATSGAWVKRTEDDYLSALSVVDACLRLVALCRPTWWCLENPVGTLHRWLGKPRTYFQPYEYGDPWTKKTCLWGDFTAPLKSPVCPTEKNRMARWGGNREMTKTLRSITPPGFARAFFLANP